MNVGEMSETGERLWNIRGAVMVLREDRRRDDDTLSHVWFAGERKTDIMKLGAPGDQVLSEPLGGLVPD